MNASIAERLNHGLRLLQGGQFEPAASVFLQILREVPNQGDAMHLLGLTCYQRGEYAAAAEWIGKAVQLYPDIPDMLINLGESLRACQRWEEAAHVLRRAIAVAPNSPHAYNNLGLTLAAQEKFDEAILAFQRAIEHHPGFADARLHLARVLVRLKRAGEAIEHAKIAAELKSHDAEARHMLGVALKDLDRLEEAEIVFGQTLALDPRHVMALVDIGAIYQQTFRIDEAIVAWERAIEIAPKFSWPYNNVATALKDTGRIDEAIAYFHRALEVDPHMSAVRSNMLLAMHYSSAWSPQDIFREHCRWQQMFRASNPFRYDHHLNARDPEKRLRIGYVSADFRSHSVADFVESVLQHHDHQQFEIVCYSGVAKPDEVTERLARCADRWRDIQVVPSPQLAELIHRDQVDILVDLAGHSALNRMVAFAMKPAPVQVTWLGYPNTTGLDTVDYRITDEFADPIGTSDSLHTEALWRMPGPFLCYHPTVGSPVVGALPADRSSVVTLASFNNFAKLNRTTLELWAQILRRLPQARLLLKATVLSHGYAQKAMERLFREVGMDETRVVLLGSEPDFFRHLDLYNHVDIGLDTYPYHGTTTTCEALYMGVPVVTLMGQAHVSRVGASLLNHVGLESLIATSREQYLEKVVALASDRDRLRELRHGLRPRLEASPLLDQPGFTRRLEEAFRQMWSRYCSSGVTTN